MKKSVDEDYNTIEEVEKFVKNFSDGEFLDKLEEIESKYCDLKYMLSWDNFIKKEIAIRTLKAINKLINKC